MPYAYASSVIPGEVRDVWEIVRPFNGSHRWNPTITKSELVQGRGQAEVGSIRRLTNKHGQEYVERLIALNDDERYVTYNLIEGKSLPVRRYISTIRLYPVTDTGETFLTWSSEYDTDSDHEAAAHRQLEGEIYAVGIEGLKQLFTQDK